MNLHRLVDETTQSKQKIVKEYTKTIIASVLKLIAIHLMTATTANQMSMSTAYTSN